MLRFGTLVLVLLGVGCSQNSPPSTVTEDGGVPINPGEDGGEQPGEPTVDGGASTPDAFVIKRGDGGNHPGSDLGPPFVNDLPDYPACVEGHAFKPEKGYSGGVRGQKRCGPDSPNCPTTYIEGNTGAPCTTAADCTGKDPICLTGDKYPGGMCAATGCEYGSNLGCPAGDFCLFAGEQTYCVQGCGIDETGCFEHCDRSEYSCFTSESTTLGYCLGSEGTRHCNPIEQTTCTREPFGDGVCAQSAWDDQSLGACYETCDVFKQDCSKDGAACYSLFEYPGYPVCFQSQGEPEGSECVRTTECAEGLRCSCDNGSFPCTGKKHCRKYCAADGDYPCPTGTFCRPLVEDGRLGSCEPQ